MEANKLSNELYYSSRTLLGGARAYFRWARITRNAASYIKSTRDEKHMFLFKYYGNYFPLDGQKLRIECWFNTSFLDLTDVNEREREESMCNQMSYLVVKISITAILTRLVIVFIHPPVEWSRLDISRHARVGYTLWAEREKWRVKELDEIFFRLA